MMNKKRMELIDITYCGCNNEQSQEMNCEKYSDCEACYKSNKETHIKYLKADPHNHVDYNCDKIREHIPTCICKKEGNNISGCNMKKCTKLVMEWLREDFKMIFNELGKHHG